MCWRGLPPLHRCTELACHRRTQPFFQKIHYQEKFPARSSDNYHVRPSHSRTHGPGRKIVAECVGGLGFTMHTHFGVQILAGSKPCFRPWYRCVPFPIQNMCHSVQRKLNDGQDLTGMGMIRLTQKSVEDGMRVEN